MFPTRAVTQAAQAVRRTVLSGEPEGENRNGRPEKSLQRPPAKRHWPSTRRCGISPSPPSPAAAKSPSPPAKRLRFVIQTHAATRLHYDFRLEWDGTFRSWAVTRGPSLDPADKRLAVEVEDHPLDYGDFEGTIPKGEYGGGTVMLWDRGFWTPEGDVEKMLAKGDLKIHPWTAKSWKGSWVLVRMKNDKYKSKRNNWLLIKHHDKFAKDGHGEAILEKDRSVASGRAMKAIAAGTGKTPQALHARQGVPKSDAVLAIQKKPKKLADEDPPEPAVKKPAPPAQGKENIVPARFRSARTVPVAGAAARRHRLGA